MRQKARKRSGRKEVATAGPSGMKCVGHTPDGPIWEEVKGKRKRAAIPPDQADQSMVERGIPIDWERGDPRIDTSGMTEILPSRPRHNKKPNDNK